MELNNIRDPYKTPVTIDYLRLAQDYSTAMGFSLEEDVLEDLAVTLRAEAETMGQHSQEGLLSALLEQPARPTTEEELRTYAQRPRRARTRRKRLPYFSVLPA